MPPADNISPTPSPAPTTATTATTITTTAPAPARIHTTHVPPVPVLKRANQLVTSDGKLPRELRDSPVPASAPTAPTVANHVGSPLPPLSTSSPSPPPPPGQAGSSSAVAPPPAAPSKKPASFGQAIRRKLLSGWTKKKTGGATSSSKDDREFLWRSHSVDVSRPTSGDGVVAGLPLLKRSGTDGGSANTSLGASGGGGGVGPSNVLGGNGHGHGHGQGHSRSMSDMTGILSLDTGMRNAGRHTAKLGDAAPRSTAAVAATASGSIARAVSLSTATATTVASPILDSFTFGPAGAAAERTASGRTEDTVHPNDATPKSPLTTTWLDIKVPLALQQGTIMTKVSLKRHKKFVFRLDPDLGQIIWESKKVKIVPLENVKEIRSGEEMRWCREQFHLSQEYADRWLTVIYVLNSGQYKTLHLVAESRDDFLLWDKTLKELVAVRQELMQGLGNIELRERLWEKLYWKNADEQKDQKLVFDEVVRLCRHLSINSSREDLFNWFKQADVKKRDYLDFDDFRRFVKLLKSRSDLDRLYKKLRQKYNLAQNVFDFTVFECFMRREQKSTIPREQLQTLFESYATDSAIPQQLGPPVVSPSLQLPPSSLSASSSSFTASPTPAAPIPIHTRCIMTSDAFASFLLSPDNSALLDHNRGVWMDMTRPLPEYFISSSHNTYLVGHQLVGESSVEGYVRALLNGCRSVELDIYDGPTPSSEPQIFHGKTFTSKVSLRQVCHTIMKYGFIKSPYPIIISAEVHCSLSSQEQIASIMIEVFGERLVRRKMEEDGRINVDFGEFGDNEGELLPSPEMLKGRILFKTKNLELVPRLPGDGMPTDSYTSASASDSEAWFNRAGSGTESGSADRSRWRSDAASKAQGTLLRARSSVMKRVRSVGRGGPSRQKHQSQPTPAPTQSSETPILGDGTVLSTSPPSLSPAPTSYNMAARVGSHTSSDVETGAAPSSASAPHSSSLPIPTTTTTPTTTLASVSTSAIPIPIPIPKSHSKHGKMAPSLLALLVYTTGVKCRGLNKKEVYFPSHMFSLSESAATKMLKYDWTSLVKHARTHLVRIYPRGVKRVGSSNFVPTRYWVGGAQLVALNWQTIDLGYVINAAMFERNAGCGYVMKPVSLRTGAGKEEMWRRRRWAFDVTVVSAQQLPPLKRDRSGAVGVGGVSGNSGGDGGSGEDEDEEVVVDPYVEVSLYIPPWPIRPPTTTQTQEGDDDAPNTAGSAPPGMTSPQILTSRTGSVMKNGFNPVWEEKLTMRFETVGDLLDLVFVRFAVRSRARSSNGNNGSTNNNHNGNSSPIDSLPPSPIVGPHPTSTSTSTTSPPPHFASPLQVLTGDGHNHNHDQDKHPPMNNSTSGNLNSAMDESDHWPEDSLGVWWGSLGSVQQGYRHLPLRDSQLSQYLFSTLFVKIGLSTH